jgi:hypothetical protein
MTNRILESFSNTITVNLSSGGIVSIDVNDNIVNANNALHIGGLPATNVVSNAQLIANLSNYLTSSYSNTATSGTLHVGIWKINFGSVVTNSSGSNTVVFNTSFVNPPYSVIVEPIANVYSAIVSVNGVSNTGVSIFSAVNTGLTNTGIQGVYYTAIGY